DISHFIHRQRRSRLRNARSRRGVTINIQVALRYFSIYVVRNKQKTPRRAILLTGVP
ncbi:hypothetical protein COCCADRAFT_100635, partial [Bipolaris zeicola 26-R-13]